MAKSEFQKAFAAARKEKGPGKTFTFNGRSYTTNYAEEAGEKAPAKTEAPKGDIVKVAEAAIDRASPTRPKSRPTGTRPQSRPTATTPVTKSASVPEVTTTELAPSEVPTVNGLTWEEYLKSNNLNKLRSGVSLGNTLRIRTKADFLKQAAEEAAGTEKSSVATRRANRGQNYAEGGVVRSRTGHTDHRKKGLFK